MASSRLTKTFSPGNNYYLKGQFLFGLKGLKLVQSNNLLVEDKTQATANL